ncbi:MAG: hypothetical protein JSS66_04605, partial [Armatimonadetes bacterium]|nr:hypothetical protein [Armatimonadota bacterium]
SSALQESQSKIAGKVVIFGYCDIDSDNASGLGVPGFRGSTQHKYASPYFQASAIETLLTKRRWSFREGWGLVIELALALSYVTFSEFVSWLSIRGRNKRAWLAALARAGRLEDFEIVWKTAFLWGGAALAIALSSWAGLVWSGFFAAFLFSPVESVATLCWKWMAGIFHK